MKHALLLGLAALASCAGYRPDVEWHAQRWRPTSSAGSIDPSADRDACIAQVVAHTQPVIIESGLVMRQSVHNALARHEMMRVCMRDRGWAPDE